MALRGRLETLTAAELLQLVARAGKSGKLMLEHAGRRGVVVCRDGRIVFAASQTLRDAVGEALERRHLVPDEAFRSEAARRGKGSLTESGSWLLPMAEGLTNDLDTVVRDQIAAVVRELVTWGSGSFELDFVDVPEAEAIALDAGGFILEVGVRPDEVLLEALTGLSDDARDEWNGEHATVIAERTPRERSEISAAFEVLIDSETGDVTWAPMPVLAPSPARSLANLRRVVDEVTEVGGLSPSLTAEVTLLVLRYAAQVVNRGVLFAVRRDGFQGIGQFGIGPARGQDAASVRDLLVPGDAVSVLAAVQRSRATYRGKLQAAEWNDLLVARLGGVQPREVVVMPLLLEGVPVALLYGDNLPETTRIGTVDGLEILLHEVALGVEKARLEQRLAEAEERAAAWSRERPS